MTKQILYDVASGLVLQWQDTDKFGYADIEPGQAVQSVTQAQWYAQGEGLHQVQNGVIAPYIAPAPALADLKVASITKVRAMRVNVFSTLAGIQSQALSNADTVTAKAISGLQDSLKALPDLDLSQCKTQADIDAAFEAGWAAIVSAAPANVVSAFNGVV